MVILLLMIYMKFLFMEVAQLSGGNGLLKKQVGGNEMEIVDSNTPKKDRKFSIKARLRSFLYAFSGIGDLFSSEQNMLIHLLATSVVVVLGFAFHVNPIEWTVLVLATGFVWVAEIFNTAIEKIMDFISDEKRPQIKFIKDISAAAVLVSAITALTAGCLIFIPKL